MARLKRIQVKQIVSAALSTVADIPGNVDEATFEGFNDDLKQMFLSSLKKKLNASPYYKQDGSSDNSAYYDIDLVPEMIDDWDTVGKCIDYITAKHRIVPKKNQQ